MTFNLLTISIIGLLAGFIFSMPVAGPIGILVTSNSLKGQIRYSNLLAAGASLADFVYIIVAVYGITHLFSAYAPVIPYILAVGSIFIIYMGVKIIRTRFDMDHISEDAEHIKEEAHLKKGKGAFYTGFMVNFLNPTLFFGWLMSSFIILSFAASMGFDTGGLVKSLDDNIQQIEKIEGRFTERPDIPSYLKVDTLDILKNKIKKQAEKPVQAIPHYHIIASVCYAASLALGSLLWFLLYGFILIRFRKKIRLSFLNRMVQALGILLCGFGAFFAWTAAKMLLH